MRLVHVFISEEQKEAVFKALEEGEIEYVVVSASSAATGGTLVEFPLPTDGVNDVLDSLREVGVDENSYVVVGSAETATTGTMERLQNRYASDFSPLATAELRSKSRDMSYDLYSFVWLVAVSAIIAAGGLLVDSPAVIVGSMVIAPLVGPVLTTGVGVVTDDRKMISDSIQLQAVGLVVAIVTSAVFSLFLRVTGFAPAGLAVSSIELVSVRLAPTMITVAIGLGAGSAAAFALTTKGPTALVGVMIAAALLPAAATVGIALVWGALIVALGSSILLAMTLIFINVAVIATLRYLGYRPDERDSDSGEVGPPPSWTAPRFAAVALLALVVTGALRERSSNSRSNARRRRALRRLSTDRPTTNWRWSQSEPSTMVDRLIPLEPSRSCLANRPIERIRPSPSVFNSASSVGRARNRKFGFDSKSTRSPLLVPISRRTEVRVRSRLLPRRRLRFQ
ncbi:DUF389 domain-containing protein [Haladaptatus pallidirubidus]|uniref:DUF389 domain-containing protein n=1 Tax=Haladaptatus pallidirubidus TaxID=1008152 RepID=UPI0035ECFE18